MGLINGDDLRDIILHNQDGWDNEIVNYYLDVIDYQPTIDPDDLIKRGKWISYTRTLYLGFDKHGKRKFRKSTMYRCSECNKRMRVKEKYCPKCGAKMSERIQKDRRETV